MPIEDVCAFVIDVGVNYGLCRKATHFSALWIHYFIVFGRNISTCCHIGVWLVSIYYQTLILLILLRAKT